MRRTVGHVLAICAVAAYNRGMSETDTRAHSPINLNVDNLIHCIRRDQTEVDLLAEYRSQRNARMTRERGRWSEYR